MSKGKKKVAVVYEALNMVDFPSIYVSLSRNVQVWIIEPFYAHHHKEGVYSPIHKRGIPGFPEHLPVYVQRLIRTGKISLLKSDEVNTKDIPVSSAEKAVAAIEAVYPAYRKKYANIIEYVSRTLKSPVAENAFKKDLCNRLAEFYSMNIMLHRVQNYMRHFHVIMHPDINVYFYLFIKRLVVESHQEFFEHARVRFAFQAYVKSLWMRLKQNGISKARLCAQAIVSGLVGSGCSSKNEKRRFSHGIAIVSPRQLRKNQRTPDFLVDDRQILSKEVAYFSLITLSKAQERKLVQLPGDLVRLPQFGKFFSHYHEWKTLLLFALKQNVFQSAEEVDTASVTFFNYFRWKKVLDSVDIKNFVIHGDFGRGHIGRNIALSQAGVQTWYFTDSGHFNFVFQEERKLGAREPAWTYLTYDHFLTWDDAIAQYNMEHPGSFEEVHVIGCIWSGNIKEKEKARKETSLISTEVFDSCYVISCFDSTYLKNVYGSYQEGIAFASHLLQLVDECPDIHILFKEKKERSIHDVLDPVFGPRLVEIYKKMDSHPRITMCTYDADASEICAVSDMVISFSFTSPTFEALSVNRPAIWHDPLGCYVNTVYGKIRGLTTHSYKELKEGVLEITSMEDETYQNPTPVDSSLMDPFRDGKAIDRFRNLLASV